MALGQPDDECLLQANTSNDALDAAIEWSSGRWPESDGEYDGVVWIERDGIVVDFAIVPVSANGAMAKLAFDAPAQKLRATAYAAGTDVYTWAEFLAHLDRLGGAARSDAKKAAHDPAWATRVAREYRFNGAYNATRFGNFEPGA